MSLELIVGGKPSAFVGDEQLGYVYHNEKIELKWYSGFLFKYFNVLPNDIKKRMETKKKVNNKFKNVNYVYVNLSIAKNMADIDYYCYTEDPKKFCHKQDFDFFDENHGSGIDLLDL